jgi:amino acid transporter
MDVKKIEKISTFAGVVLLAMLAVFGILGCLELVFDIDYFASRRTADVWTVIPLITCVLIFCCFVVSTMLNVSRIASSVEKLVEKQDSGDNRVAGETVKEDNE